MAKVPGQSMLITDSRNGLGGNLNAGVIHMVLVVLRGSFIVLVAAVTMLYVLPFQADQEISFPIVVMMLLAALAVSAAVVATDFYSANKNLSAGSGVFLGLLAGLLGAYAMSFVIDLIGLIAAPLEMKAQTGPIFNLLQGVKVFIGLVTCYIGISLVLQTKDDFRFVIPYVEFSREIRGNRPTLLDTSVIIDGRILDLVQTKLMQGSLIVPKFVLNELQLVADSGDKLRRARGRRGLDVLQKLQELPFVDITIAETEAEGSTVDQKLVAMAKSMEARVMTNDFNLNKIATLRGVEVINLNDVAKALRPVVLPGENMRVQIVKHGEGATQGVGYLEDGTMVVVEGARHHMGQDIELTVTSMLQTSAGRMIFGRFVGEETGRTASHGPVAQGAGSTYGSAAPASVRKSHPPAAPSESESHGAEHHETTDTNASHPSSPAGPEAGSPSPDTAARPTGPASETGPAGPGGNEPHRPPPRQGGFYGRNPRRSH